MTFIYVNDALIEYEEMAALQFTKDMFALEDKAIEATAVCTKDFAYMVGFYLIGPDKPANEP